MDAKIAEQLHNMVDQVGVANILDELAIVCSAKAKTRQGMIQVATWQVVAESCTKEANRLRKHV